MSNKFKLVICDIDGTLVGQNRTLTDNARAVINDLHQRGVYFGLASGRPIDEVIHLVREVWHFNEIIDIIIGMNGSELVDNIRKEAFEYFKLSKESLKEIVDLMEPFNLNPCIYRPGAMLCRELTEQVKTSISRSGKKAITADSITDFYSEDAAKIMFRTNPETLNKVESFMKINPSKNYNAFRTGPTIIEFADARVSKAYALNEFCNHNQINLNEVIAFGDTSNDNEMLKASGIGVCLLNGSDDTKSIADYITNETNDNDGFVEFMNKEIITKNII